MSNREQCKNSDVVVAITEKTALGTPSAIRVTCNGCGRVVERNSDEYFPFEWDALMRDLSKHTVTYKAEL